MPYDFKTLGREYSFTLESDGLLHCKALGLKHESLDELKALVTVAVKKEKNLPRIPVLLLGDRWDDFSSVVEGSASGKADRSGYRWVTYLGQRKQFSESRLYQDTPANRMYAESVIALRKQIDNLSARMREIRDELMVKIGEETD